jgi:hypothetical protein
MINTVHCLFSGVVTAVAIFGSVLLKSCNAYGWLFLDRIFFLLLCYFCERFEVYCKNRLQVSWCPHSSTRLGANFPTSVAARKSITAQSHFSMESSSETCTCRHLPAFQPVVFPHRFPEHFLLVFPPVPVAEEMRLPALPPPPHHQHLSSSRCPNRFKYVPTGVCPHFSR